MLITSDVQETRATFVTALARELTHIRKLHARGVIGVDEYIGRETSVGNIGSEFGIYYADISAAADAARDAETESKRNASERLAARGQYPYSRTGALGD